MFVALVGFWQNDLGEKVLSITQTTQCVSNMDAFPVPSLTRLSLNSETFEMLKSNSASNPLHVLPAKDVHVSFNEDENYTQNVFLIYTTLSTVLFISYLKCFLYFCDFDLQ